MKIGMTGILAGQKRIRLHRGRLFSWLFFLLCASNGHAVLRPQYATAHSDTLFLPSDEIQQFKFNKQCGSDLENIGLGLTVASFFSPILLYAAMENASIGVNAAFLLVFPTSVAVMAMGNYLYGRAAELDTNNVYAISSPTKAYLAFAATAINFGLFFGHLGCGDGDNQGRCEKHLYYAIPFLAEVILVPIFRIQFNRAKEILENVEVLVTPGDSRLRVKFDF